MIRIHHLKTWPDLFEEILIGLKDFEYRKNDRNFQVGDILILMEYNLWQEAYTERNINAVVQRIYSAPGRGFIEVPGLPQNYVLMKIRVLSYNVERSDVEVTGT